jgi:hypothetical protein
MTTKTAKTKAKPFHVVVNGVDTKPIRVTVPQNGTVDLEEHDLLLKGKVKGVEVTYGMPMGCAGRGEGCMFVRRGTTRTIRLVEGIDDAFMPTISC